MAPNSPSRQTKLKKNMAKESQLRREVDMDTRLELFQFGEKTKIK
jgi:hypothetical protein